MPTPTFATEAARARVGTTVDGRWRLDAILAVGGTSAIYAASGDAGRRAAMKVLDGELAENTTAVQHFLREGRAANAVGHPGAVVVLEEGTTDDGAPFLVMPLLEGETAQQVLERHPHGIGTREALVVVEAVLDVLVAAHARGVVHRDLKPDNVFLERSGAVRVLDFGIARLPGVLDLTLYGTVLGTAGYLPPEQARGRLHEVGPRSDLWSVGALLVTLLTGRVLHSAPHLTASILRAQSEPVPPASELVPGVGDTIARVLDGALAFDPERRWADARAMRDAVREALAEVRASEKAESCPGVAVDSIAPVERRHRREADGPTTPAAKRRWTSSRTLGASALAACLAAAWAVAAFLVPGRTSMSVNVAAPVAVALSATEAGTEAETGTETGTETATGTEAETAPARLHPLAGLLAGEDGGEEGSRGQEGAGRGGRAPRQQRDRARGRVLK